MKFNRRSDRAGRINNHRPRQVRNFPSPQACLDGQQNNHLIANWIPRALGEGEEGLYVVIKQNFCLLPCHYVSSA